MLHRTLPLRGSIHIWCPPRMPGRTACSPPIVWRNTWSESLPLPHHINTSRLTHLVTLTPGGSTGPPAAAEICSHPGNPLKTATRKGFRVCYHTCSGGDSPSAACSSTLSAASKSPFPTYTHQMWAKNYARYLGLGTGYEARICTTVMSMNGAFGRCPLCGRLNFNIMKTVDSQVRFLAKTWTTLKTAFRLLFESSSHAEDNGTIPSFISPSHTDTMWHSSENGWYTHQNYPLHTQVPFPNSPGASAAVLTGGAPAAPWPSSAALQMPQCSQTAAGASGTAAQPGAPGTCRGRPHPRWLCC